MPQLAQVGDFCPNSACVDYGKRQDSRQKNIIRFGRTAAGRQRYRCNTCRRTFVETTGTVFYGRRTPAAEIIDTLTLVAEDSRISSLARAKGHKEDTISAWIAAAGAHAEELEAVLLAEHQIVRGQLDGLWAYVQNKGEKKAMPKPRRPGSFGAPP